MWGGLKQQWRAYLPSAGYYYLNFTPSNLEVVRHKDDEQLTGINWIMVTEPSYAVGTCIADVRIESAGVVLPRKSHHIPIIDTDGEMITADQAFKELFSDKTAAEYESWLASSYVPVGEGQLPICECGAEAAGCGGHSVWCPKY